MKQVSKTTLIAAVGIFLVVSSIFIHSVFLNQKTEIRKELNITTSFYPINFLVNSIAKDTATITNLTPNGIEPHDYELTPKDIEEMQKSDLLIYQGGQFESWEEEIKNDNKLSINGNLNSNLDLIQSGNQQDPHTWLDMTLFRDSASIIKNKLIEIDRDNQSKYEQNYYALATELDKLDIKYSDKFSVNNCSTNKFVTSHKAFGYLAKRYGLEQIAISGISPESEPSSQDLALVTETIKQNNLKYIFTESLMSPKLVDTIATETGAKTLVLDPIESPSDEEMNSGVDYFTKMNQNLENLSIALGCK